MSLAERRAGMLASGPPGNARIGREFRLAGPFDRPIPYFTETLHILHFEKNLGKTHNLD
jgi:hypothetical protein